MSYLDDHVHQNKIKPDTRQKAARVVMAAVWEFGGGGGFPNCHGPSSSFPSSVSSPARAGVGSLWGPGFQGTTFISL